jgi:hypothetical protein
MNARKPIGDVTQHLRQDGAHEPAWLCLQPSLPVPLRRAERAEIDTEKIPVQRPLAAHRLAEQRHSLFGRDALTVGDQPAGQRQQAPSVFDRVIQWIEAADQECGDAEVVVVA